MRFVITACFAILFLTVIQCYGQNNDCSDLLRHGIYDHFRESGDSSSYSRTQKELCKIYNELKKDIAKGKAKASYNLFSGKTSLSREQLEVVARQMCSHDFSESSAKDLLEKASSVINPAAVEAYRDCIANSASGLKSETEYTQDDVGVKNITITVHYDPDKGMIETPLFKGIIISPKGAFECSGDLCDYKKGKPISTSAHTTVFTRKFSSIPFEEHGRKLYASAGSITISTSAGSITRRVIPVFAQPSSDIARRLTEAELQIEELKDKLNHTKTLQILSGEVIKKVNPHNPNDPKWNLYRGKGEREIRENIRFDYPFKNNPNVVVNLSYIDVPESVGHHRIKVRQENVTKGGFTIVFTTWDNSKVIGVGAGWIALGDKQN